MYGFESRIVINKDFIECPNVAEYLDVQDISKIEKLVWDGYTKDLASRISWERRNEAGMDLAMQIQRDKNFPWQGCANVTFPLVTIASLQFGSRAYGNIIQGPDVVQYRVVGDDDSGELTKRAARIGRHMSWQLLEEDMGWEEGQDRLLINLAIVGCNFKKSFFDPARGHNVGELVMARDLVMDYWARSVDDCGRKTQHIVLSRNEIYEGIQSDVAIYCNVLDEAWFKAPPSPTATATPLGAMRHDQRQGITPSQSDEDTPFQCLEQHRNLDLDGDGYAEPYIVTITKESQKLLRIVPRFERPEDVDRNSAGRIRKIRRTEYFTKYTFIPAPDGGMYDLGFGTLLGPINESVNTGINQLLDAGTMATSNGGFLGRGAKFRGGSYTVAPWEWKRVDATGDDLRKSMVPLPVREPSTVTFQLLGFLVQYADRLAGTVDAMVGENPGQNTKSSVYQGTLEQGMEVFSQVFKRVWRSMKEEFKKNHRLNSLYLPVRQRFGSKDAFILREDYKSDPDLVVPAADPHIISPQQRMQVAATVRQAAHSVNGYNLEEVEKRFLRALRVEGIDTVYPGPDKVQPLPNPKVQIENMKFESKKMTLETEKWKTIVQLKAAQRETEAKITLLEAQAVSLMAGIEGDAAARKLEAFEVVMNALKEHGEMMNERIQSLMQSGESDGSEGNPDRRGVPELANSEGNPGVPGASSPSAGNEQGSLGSGTVQ